MGKIIEIQLGEHRPVICCDQNDVVCNRNDHVIVEVEQAMEFGRVVSDTQKELLGQIVPEGKVIRKVTEGDMNQIKNNRIKAQDAISTCIRKVNERRMEMQIIKAEYTFDCSKVIFFYTADGRIDFRALVKDLAKVLRVRIEMNQKGVRDRSKFIGGFGVCGRELCCKGYMKCFHPLTIKMAKEQALPLNPSRISGICGRTKCCMAYEYTVYHECGKDLPHIGDKVMTPEGKGRVKDVNILKKNVVVDLGEGKIVKLTYGQSEQK